MGRHRRLHEHDQLLRRQRPGRARLRLPAQRRADRLRLRPALARRLLTRTCRRPARSRGRAWARSSRSGTASPEFAIGAAGGSTIITTVVQTLINHVDFGMSLPDALAAPRVSQTNSSSNTSLGRAGLLQQRARPAAHEPVRREVLARHRVDPPARQLSGGCDRAADARARPGRGDRRAGPPRRRQRAGGEPKSEIRD